MPQIAVCLLVTPPVPLRQKEGLKTGNHNSGLTSRPTHPGQYFTALQKDLKCTPASAPRHSTYYKTFSKKRNIRLGIIPLTWLQLRDTEISVER